MYDGCKTYNHNGDDPLHDKSYGTLCSNHGSISTLHGYCMLSTSVIIITIIMGNVLITALDANEVDCNSIMCSFV